MVENDWQRFNQKYLMASLSQIHQLLAAKAGQEIAANEIQPESEIPSALEQLCLTFGLSTFERDILLLCAGSELNSGFPALCALAQGDPQQNYPTFSLALNLLRDPHWSAFTPSAPLRRWKLIELGGGKTLTSSPLRISERILHYLTGIQHLDEQLFGLVEPVREISLYVNSHQQIADTLSQTWSINAGNNTLPIVQLCGDEIYSKRAIASAACRQLELNLHTISATVIPSNRLEVNQFLRLWEREAVLNGSALLLDFEDFNENSVEQTAIAYLIEQISSPLILASRERILTQQRAIVYYDVVKPTLQEQQSLWQTALADKGLELNGSIDALSQFNLSAPEIKAACTNTLGKDLNDPAALKQSLWNACRIQARPRLESLAQRIETVAGWSDIVLPAPQLETMQTIVAHVRQRVKVYQTWGFATKSDRGLGISALFAGPSGTGKTTAAEVIARELNLDLYRIDLSSVVSKYIGETEKNLRRIFDAAESGGAILLFDEADALFGKRSEVKDSHDRHANIEVSYLLQRMEAYRGLAILTTNLKGSLDTAFMRRIRFVVQFAFPDLSQRAEIWQRVFPQKTPTYNLDASKLAKLSVAGGNIRNIALNAAFIAAEADEPVNMAHILSAARSEHAKLDKPLVDSQVKGWV
ncbi:ATP-binding protein [Pleurocapsales cyanobacterium LEGE 10410]|nr:ATP-binding protein [Pleurocapsales cyanobacterium LEGE 10410]